MSTVDPADSVKELLEQAEGPLSTEQIEQALAGVHERHHVEQALDFWRREHAVAHDEDGNWTWRGMPGE